MIQRILFGWEVLVWEIYPGVPQLVTLVTRSSLHHPHLGYLEVAGWAIPLKLETLLSGSSFVVTHTPQISSMNAHNPYGGLGTSPLSMLWWLPFSISRLWQIYPTSLFFCRLHHHHLWNCIPPIPPLCPSRFLLGCTSASQLGKMNLFGALWYPSLLYISPSLVVLISQAV